MQMNSDKIVAHDNVNKSAEYARQVKPNEPRQISNSSDSFIDESPEVVEKKVKNDRKLNGCYQGCVVSEIKGLETDVKN